MPKKDQEYCFIPKFQKNTIFCQIKTLNTNCLNILGGIVSDCGTVGGYGLAVDLYYWRDWIYAKAFGGKFCEA